MSVHTWTARRFALPYSTSLRTSPYDIPPYQVQGPDWMGPAIFDISAKMPDGADPKQARAMLRLLLEDRFGLRAHRDMKEFPVYALEVAKMGLKMKELPP